MEGLVRNRVLVLQVKKYIQEHQNKSHWIFRPCKRLKKDRMAAKELYRFCMSWEDEHWRTITYADWLTNKDKRVL